MMNRRNFNLYAVAGFVSLLTNTKQSHSAVTTAFSVVNVKNYGAKGDGITDDYLALKRAFAKINQQKTGTLYFPPGTYLIGVHKISNGGLKNNVTDLELKNCTNVAVYGAKATIVCRGGWIKKADYLNDNGHTYSFHDTVGLSFTNCRNLKVSSLIFDGGANTIIKEATAEGGSYGILLSGCYDVELSKLHIHHCCTDGLYVAERGNWSPNYDNYTFKVTQRLTVTDCVFDRNARQGMSIIQLRYATFTRCIFSNTGYTGLYGSHAPAAGVDIEPNYVHDDPTGVAKGDHSTGNITFTDCQFINNHGFEFVATGMDSTKHPVQLTKCLFKNTQNSEAAVVPAAANTTFTDCYFDEVGLWPNYATPDVATVTKVINCGFKSSQPQLAILLMVDYVEPILYVKGCLFKLDSPVAHTWYRLFLRGENISFLNNSVSISSKEAINDGNIDIVAILNCRQFSGNTCISNTDKNMHIGVLRTGLKNNKLKNIVFWID